MRVVSKLLRAFVLVALGLLPATEGALAAAPPPSDRDLVRELGRVRVSYHSATGKVRFVGASAGRPMARAAGVAADAAPESAARAWLGRYGRLFGLRAAAADLRALRVGPVRGGRSGVRFQQLHRGIPVLAGELNVQLDGSRNVLSANGELSPALAVSVVPEVNAGKARERALAAVAKAHRRAAGTLRATQPALWVYDPALVGAPGLPVPRLAWRLEVRGTGLEPLDEMVLVDALRGAVLLRFNQVHAALSRYVCDRKNAAGESPLCTSPYTRTEGSGPAGITDVDLAYDYSGHTYNFFYSRFRRDSLDNAGLPLRSTVRYCPSAGECPYDNAYWDGDARQMVYGAGYAAADDVVGHELTHGVTDHESQLLYVYQSGAINESISDIFGELIDLTNGAGYDDPAVRWHVGEQAPVGVIRNMADPPQYRQPDRVRSDLYWDDPQFEDNGGVHVNSGVGNKAAYLMADGGTFNSRTVTALGLEKTARIWYEANANLLTSGSDYQDLYDYLQQACVNSVGSAGITTADCGQFKNAVDATEMNLQPVRGAAPEAPVCGPGEAARNLFYDNLENRSTGNWTPSTAVGVNGWTYDTFYATSGRMHLFGEDYGSVSDTSLIKTANVLLPAAPTYLHFRHAYDFEHYGGTFYDGGVVEYSVNGRPWTDAGALFTDNGYNATLATDFRNPLAGRRAFGGFTYGYYSSRMNLSSFAGQNVRVRFRIGADVEVAGGGWAIDDVRIYNCGTPADLQVVSLTDSPDPVLVGNHLAYTATFKNSGPTTAYEVVGRFSLPSGVTFLGASPGCTHAGGAAYGGRSVGGAVSCGLGTLATGATAVRSVFVGPVNSGSWTATASIQGLVVDSVAANNSRSTTTGASFPAGQASRCTRIGTAGNDTMWGTSSNDVFCSFAGNDAITGQAGNDVINGGPGTDRAAYGSATAGVYVNLTTGNTGCNPGTAACGQGADKLIWVEDASGSARGDKLLGSGAWNRLYGGAASDYLYGGVGNDGLFGQDGNDYLYGQDGNDYLDGGNGTDYCSQGTGTGTIRGCP